jgi:hypothetical protein
LSEPKPARVTRWPEGEKEAKLREPVPNSAMTLALRLYTVAEAGCAPYTITKRRPNTSHCTSWIVPSRRGRRFTSTEPSTRM